MMKSVDRKIIDILLRDARTTHVQIAEEVGLSRPAIAERVKKLEQAGVIKGYTAVTSPQALGKPMTAFISAKQVGVTEKASREEIMALLHDERILEVHDIAGDDCYLLKTRITDVRSLNEIVKMLGRPPYSMTTKTTIALDTYFEKIGGTTLLFDSQE